MATKPDASRPERAALSRGRIIEAAFHLIDRDGLEALTMKRLGSELGVEAMSLYFHLPNKEATLSGVVDLLLSEVALPEEEGQEWGEVSLRLFSNLRRRLLDHPNTIPLVATRLAGSVEALVPIEMSLRVLRQAGFDAWAAIDGHRLLMSFTVGHVLAQVTARSETSGHPENWGIAAYALQVAPPDRVPNLAELAPIALAGSADEQFDRCLGYILSALDALPREPRGRAAPAR